jgi:phosphoenolpyruvate-protein kinase (PTS system EI component)
MNPPAIPLAKQIIRAVPLEQAQQVAEAALTLESAAAVQELAREQLPSVNLR